MKIRVLAIVIIALLALPGGSGVPAETAAPGEEKPRQDQQQQEPQQPSEDEPQPQQQQQQQQKAEDELQEFVPSEEVSPDLSISFPVDI